MQATVDWAWAERQTHALAVERADMLLDDVLCQAGAARRLVHHPDADDALAVAAVIAAGRAAEQLDVAGLSILARRLRRHACFGTWGD
jgi:hypothetical protein